jgi:hypothetical protein
VEGLSVNQRFLVSRFHDCILFCSATMYASPAESDESTVAKSVD